MALSDEVLAACEDAKINVRWAPVARPQYKAVVERAADKQLLQGRLIPVLMGWQLPLLTMNIAYQNRVRLPAKIRVFSDFLIQHIRQNSETGIWMDA